MSDYSHLQSASLGAFTGRVGHKAGGFISKKFFHPSSFKNKEKLWSAIEERQEKEKRQEELMKKREEERRVELLKKEMQEATGRTTSLAPGLSQRSAGGGLFSNLSNVSDKESVPDHEKQAMLETKRRIQALEHDMDAARSTVRIQVNSRYPEDVHEHGHSQVWGSYFDISTRKWGYSCCHVLVKGESCTNDIPPSSKRSKHS